jgi:glycosyltransferase involved in cell wall biosynthesis
MKMAYLVSQYPAVNHTYILREVKALRTLGVDVQVISISSPDRPMPQLSLQERQEAESTWYVKKAPLLRVIQAHLLSLFSRPRRYLRGFSYAIRLGRLQPRDTFYHLMYFAEAVVVGRWMRRSSLDHVHIHFSSTVGLLAAQVFPITFSLTVHGPDEFINPEGFHLAEKVKAALFVCGISRFGIGQLMRASDCRHWEKLHFAPLGVDPNAFPPRPAHDVPSLFQIMSVGRLSPVKGHALLLEAIEQLANRGQQILLRLVGDGPERTTLERIVEERGLSQHVTFEGFVNQDRLKELYRECDAFVLPSFAEGVPVVLMESMAMEIPCIATWVGGVPELIRDGVDGLLVAGGDIDSLMNAIRKLAGDPELRRRLGVQARQRVFQQYNLQKNTERLADIFQTSLQPSVQMRPSLQRRTHAEHAIPHE